MILEGPPTQLGDRRGRGECFEKEDRNALFTRLARAALMWKIDQAIKNESCETAEALLQELYKMSYLD